MRKPVISNMLGYIALFGAVLGIVGAVWMAATRYADVFMVLATIAGFTVAVAIPALREEEAR